MSAVRTHSWAQLNVRLIARAALLFALSCLSVQAQTTPLRETETPNLVQSPPVTPTATPIPKPTPKPKPITAKPPKLSAAELVEGRALLTGLGYWLQAGSVGMDASLKHAVTAFQKVAGRTRTGVLTKEELLALQQAQRPKAVDPTHGYIEVDLNRQVLLVVDATGEVQRILPVSTGSGELFTEGGRTRRAVTPTGKFKVQRKIAGWRASALGLLYYPNYFVGGVAIHGNPSVPTMPASHGCIRIPMFAAKEFFELTPVGIEVLIYGDQPATVTATGPCKPPTSKP